MLTGKVKMTPGGMGRVCRKVGSCGVCEARAYHVTGRQPALSVDWYLTPFLVQPLTPPHFIPEGQLLGCKVWVGPVGGVCPECLYSLFLLAGLT
jgi:hypothetical protein